MPSLIVYILVDSFFNSNYVYIMKTLFVVFSCPLVGYLFLSDSLSDTPVNIYFMWFWRHYSQFFVCIPWWCLCLVLKMVLSLFFIRTAFSSSLYVIFWFLIHGPPPSHLVWGDFMLFPLDWSWIHWCLRICWFGHPWNLGGLLFEDLSEIGWGRLVFVINYVQRKIFVCAWGVCDSVFATWVVALTVGIVGIF